MSVANSQKNNLHRICIGTANMGINYGIKNNEKKIPLSEVNEIIKICESYNINLLDTAQAYGDAEYKLGKLTNNNFNIITKLSLQNNFEFDIGQKIKDSISSSLNALRKDKLHGVLIHDSELLENKNGIVAYKALEDLRNQGLIDNIGISIYDPNEYLKLKNFFNFDIVQLPFNVFDHRFINSNVIDNLKNDSVEVYLRSIFLQGLLLMPPNKIPLKFNKWKPHFELYNEWLVLNKVSRLESCINFVLNFSGDAKIVVGVDNKNHLLDVIKILEAERIEIPKIFEINDTDLINPFNWNKQ